MPLFLVRHANERENSVEILAESLMSIPWSLHYFTFCRYTHALRTDCSYPCFACTSGKDPKAKGKATEEIPPKTGYCSDGQRILKDQQENPDLHSVAQRESYWAMRSWWIGQLFYTKSFSA